jgi:hypothetical protein
MLRVGTSRNIPSGPNQGRNRDRCPEAATNTEMGPASLETRHESGLEALREDRELASRSFCLLAIR